MTLLRYATKLGKIINVNIIVFLIKKSYSIEKVAKLFKSKIKYLEPRKGERYASALSSMSYNNLVHKSYGKKDLKDYVASFLKKHNKSKKKLI